MKKSTPVQMRQSLEAVEEFKKAGIRFMPVPVYSEYDYRILIQYLHKRLKDIENESEEKS